MKALGAGKAAVASVFFAEATLLALIGGLIGFGAGALLARQIGHSIFNSAACNGRRFRPRIASVARP